MRTITQRTTFPFLIAESGAASFTLAVTTSPSPARRPRSPPRGKMQASLRAPELSATSRIVRIPIISRFAPGVGGRGPGARENRAFPGPWPLTPGPRLDLHVQFHRLHAHLRRPPDHFRQLPSLQLAQRPALHDAHYVARLGRA